MRGRRGVAESGCSEESAGFGKLKIKNVYDTPASYLLYPYVLSKCSLGPVAAA